MTLPVPNEPHHGLTQTEVQARQRQYGPNALPETPPTPLWQRFLAQFKSPLIYILLFALALDLFLWYREGAEGIPFESVAIGLILLLNAGLGVWQERKAEAALVKLKGLAAPQVWVLRDGAWAQVPSTGLVPGDWIRVESGDRIPADATVQEGGLLVDESVLTGESLPVDKTPQDQALSGTLAVLGKAYLEVKRIGATSNLGQLATLLGQVQAEQTPLERRLQAFGNQIARWVLGLAVAITVGGVLTQGLEHLGPVLLFAVALAVAAVPEGLPAVLSLTLALGVERMAKRKAVVRRLAAVEALGSVTVIATDKTGTLTENQMQVRGLDTPSPKRALRAIVLANDADYGAGDPLEVALLSHAQSQGQDPAAIRQNFPRSSVRSFDSGAKYMRVTVREEGKAFSYLKGAPEILLERCALSRSEYASWSEKAVAYASQGYRVLGLAWGEGEKEEGLAFGGLILFWDPPRPEVPEAIGKAQEAGIRVLMISGDHPATALAIAQQIGIPGERVLTGEDLEDYTPEGLNAALQEINVFARVSPEHKLRLIDLLKSQGEVVAMTGDGVNDAPALKRSDVGVAMGQRGSDVTREVADLVLLDDNFATIVAAIEEGRSIYENIQKFLRFLFSTNLAEVLLISIGAFLAFVLGLRETNGDLLLPLLAVQILWINLVTDGLPALSLALDRNPGVMRAAPRPASSPLLGSSALRFVGWIGASNALLGLGLLGLVPRLGYGLGDARTVAFHFLAIAQFFLAYPSRHTHLRPLSNPVLHLVVWGGVGLQILIGSLSPTTRALGLTQLPLELWGLILSAGLFSLASAKIIGALLWRNRSEG